MDLLDYCGPVARCWSAASADTPAAGVSYLLSLKDGQGCRNGPVSQQGWWNGPISQDIGQLVKRVQVGPWGEGSHHVPATQHSVQSSPKLSVCALCLALRFDRPSVSASPLLPPPPAGPTSCTATTGRPRPSPLPTAAAPSAPSPSTTSTTGPTSLARPWGRQTCAPRWAFASFCFSKKK